jgi:sugar-specific transcriptional regulator TrmB
MKENVINIQEDVIIKQKDKKIILEKGDRIKVLKEARAPKMKVNPAKDSLEKDISSISNTLSNMIDTAGNNYQTASFAKILKSIKKKVDDLIVPYF